MTKKEAISAVSMRVLKVADTPSLSGRSQLTYHIGCDAEGDIHFRVVANTGSGQFNSDWVPLPMVEKLLTAHPSSKPMTSGSLRSVFRHRSSNSPAFLFAALKAESLVLPREIKDAGYGLGDVEGFKQAMSELIADDINLDTASVAKPPAIKRKRSKENA